MEKKLKPFNLAAAKAGQPVVTRDGRKARIVCFDLKRNDVKPLVVLIENTFDKEESISLYCQDGSYEDVSTSDFDLFMAPVMKEVWIALIEWENCQFTTHGPYNSQLEAFAAPIESPLVYKSIKAVKVHEDYVYEAK